MIYDLNAWILRGFLVIVLAEFFSMHDNKKNSLDLWYRFKDNVLTFVRGLECKGRAHP